MAQGKPIGLRSVGDGVIVVEYDGRQYRVGPGEAVEIPLAGPSVEIPRGMTKWPKRVTLVLMLANQAAAVWYLLTADDAIGMGKACFALVVALWLSLQLDETRR